MDFSWYTFTTGGPALVLRPAMVTRAQAHWFTEMKVMVCKHGDPTVIVLILEGSVHACLNKQGEDA